MLVKRSFTISGHRTSVALEPAFWAALEGMAAAESMALSALVTRLDAGRDAEEPLTSRLRVAALTSAQRSACETASR